VQVTASNSGGSQPATSKPSATIVANGSSGYRDNSYTGAGVGPSGSKPESKAWFNDGSWWASMWSTARGGFDIFQLDTSNQRLNDTGVALDPRAGSRADVLWDGTHLYVASHIFSTCGCSTSSPGHPSLLYRYSYDPLTRTYSLDSGFPAQINNTSTETLVIDKDSTGTLWATWAQDSKVMVSHTQNGDDRSWITPYVMPATGAANLDLDDISDLIAFDGNKLGVMWSNQNDSAVYFAIHPDGTSDSNWSGSFAIHAPGYADDHLNLKSLSTDGSGRVFAIAKTSLNDGTSPVPTDPLVMLYVRSRTTGWSSYPVWQVQDGVTRPILEIDTSNMILHAFATSSDTGGSIKEKTSPVNSISFATGKGTTFMKDAANSSINNPTAGKQNVTHSTGLFILASNDATNYYWHAFETLP
jgi:hypothetical protein